MKSKATKPSVIANIEWMSKQVAVEKIKPSPTNYKIKTDLGRERLQTSLKKYGLASNVVVNQAEKGYYYLIDGNSRLKEAQDAKLKTIWVSLPSRKLSPKEFKEMCAMFDFAKAGEVDIEAIDRDLGTSEDFYKTWAREIPLALLSTLGAKQSNDKLPGVQGGKDKVGKIEDVNSDIRLVNLFFTEKQESEFRQLEIKLAKKFKTSSTTDTILKALKSIK